MYCFSHKNILATLKRGSDMCFKDTEQKSSFDLHKNYKRAEFKIKKNTAKHFSFELKQCTPNK